MTTSQGPGERTNRKRSALDDGGDGADAVKDGKFVNLRVSMGNIITYSLLTTLFGHDYGAGAWICDHQSEEQVDHHAVNLRVSMGISFT